MTVQHMSVHATCIAYGDRGVLLTGPSGSGKSDLALRMISQPIIPPPGQGPQGQHTRPQTARLVADDQVVLTRADDRLIARCPETLAGLLEVRGLGIVTVDFQPETEISLVAELVARDAVERLPPPGQTCSILGLAVRTIRLHAFEASSPQKLALALIGNIAISQ